MADIGRTVASLRIFGDFEPEDVSLLLSAQPSSSYRKGDPHHNPRVKPRSVSLWSFEAPEEEPGDLETQIRFIFDALSQDLAVWKELSQKYEVDLFAGLFIREWNEGFSLSVEVMKMLVDRGVEIGFDVYSPSHDELEE